MFPPPRAVVGSAGGSDGDGDPRGAAPVPGGPPGEDKGCVDGSFVVSLGYLTHPPGNCWVGTNRRVGTGGEPLTHPNPSGRMQPLHGRVEERRLVVRFPTPGQGAGHVVFLAHDKGRDPSLILSPLARAEVGNLHPSYPTTPPSLPSSPGTGFADFLEKPIRFDALCAVLHTAARRCACPRSGDNVLGFGAPGPLLTVWNPVLRCDSECVDPRHHHVYHLLGSGKGSVFCINISFEEAWGGLG